MPSFQILLSLQMCQQSHAGHCPWQCFLLSEGKAHTCTGLQNAKITWVQSYSVSATVSFTDQQTHLEIWSSPGWCLRHLAILCLCNKEGPSPAHLVSVILGEDWWQHSSYCTHMGIKLFLCSDRKGKARSEPMNLFSGLALSTVSMFQIQN